MNTAAKRALFLDRDGVINVEKITSTKSKTLYLWRASSSFAERP
jgi:histidinol phosphatase-like enzyme